MAVRKAVESNGPADWPVTPRMVGREQELRLLRAALRTAPGLVLVVGEAGVGKTRLVSEVAAEHPARWLIGRCRPLQDPRPLAPVIEALMGLHDSEAVLRTGSRHSVFTSVVELLAGAGPAVLLIEDLHWADPGTLQLLRFVASRLPPDVQVVCTYRYEDAQHAGEITALAGCVPAGTRTAEVRVEPLGRDAVRALAQELLGLDLLPAALTDDLAERAGGLPFVVEEFLRDLPRGALDEQALLRAITETRAPVALRASMTIRLQQVPDICRQVVFAAAVLDSPSSEALLGAVAEVSGCQLTTAMDTALARGLLGEPKPGLFDLRHALAQRAVYETIPPDAVRRLHRQAASVLAGIEPAPHHQVAEHSRLGGSLGEWMIHAELAADRSADAASAVEQLISMLEVEALPWVDRARLAAKLGRAAGSALRWQDAIVVMKSVLAESGVASPVRGRLRLALGMLLHDQAGEVLAGRRELVAALDELDDDPDSAAWALSALAVPTFGSSDIGEHREWRDRAMSLIGADPELQLAVRGNQARFRLAVGEVDEADGVEVAGGLAWLGHDRRSAALLDRAVETEDAYLKVGIAAVRLRLAFAAGNWVGLPERVARVRFDAAAAPLVRAEVELIDARLRLAQGDVAGGNELLESVLGATELGPLPLRAAAVAAKGELGALEDCVAAIRRKQGWAWAGEFVVVACSSLQSAGRREDAHRLAVEFAAAVADLDAPAAAAAAKQVRAIVEESVELFEVAAEQWRAIGRGYAECLALEGRGLLLLADGHSDDLVSTTLAFDAMGARGDARRCRDALREAGVAVASRRGRRGYGNALSPRELEVARLASQGLSNSRIAAALTLSVSTVEDHLSHAMRKLEVRSRHDLGPLISP